MEFKKAGQYVSVQELEGISNGIKIRSSGLYGAIDQVVQKYEPSMANANDMQWSGLYIRIDNNESYMPLQIIKHKGEYFLSIGNSYFTVAKGDDHPNPLFMKIAASIASTMESIEKLTYAELKERVPIAFQTGRILGKYVLGKDYLIDSKAAAEIKEKYERHMEKRLEISMISLNDYLGIAKLCYEAIYPNDARMAARELYCKYSDERHGGMLELPEESKESYMRWLNSTEWQGSHPFEIIKGYRDFEIILMPPFNSKRFGLVLGSNAYAREYIAIVAALIDNNVAFEAPQLGSALDYLTGNTYFTVNKNSSNAIFIDDAIEQIEWDKLPIAKRRA